MGRSFRLSPPTSRRRRPASPVVVPADNPQGVGACDGCGAIVAYPRLVELYHYAGTPRPSSPMYGPGGGPGGPLVPTGLKMCPSCQDVPNGQFSPQVLGPDPVPLPNPRPDFQNPFYILTENNNIIATEDDDPLEWT